MVDGTRSDPTDLLPHCHACGYDLTGNTSGIYPECGERRRSLREISYHIGGRHLTIADFHWYALVAAACTCLFLSCFVRTGIYEISFESNTNRLYSNLPYWLQAVWLPSALFAVACTTLVWNLN